MIVITPFRSWNCHYSLLQLTLQFVTPFQIRFSFFQALIHVSTAYSNADKEEILETVYPLSANIFNEMKSEDDILCNELLTRIGRKLQTKHPNTYTVTKAMAEWMVAEYSEEIPAAIVRPSIGKAYHLNH